MARLRGAYMHALLHLDMTFHGGATTKPEETVCALNRDCAAIEAAISHRVAKTLRTISTFVLAAALAFTRSWEVAMVALALAPVVGAATALVARAAQHGAEEARSGYAAAGALAAQTICHARAVVALQAERRLLERFVDMVAAPRRLFAWGPAATAAAHGAVATAEIVTCGPPPSVITPPPLYLQGFVAAPPCERPSATLHVTPSAVPTSVLPKQSFAAKSDCRVPMPPS